MAGYGSDVGLAAWLTANGYTAVASGLSQAILRQRGSAYIDAVYGGRFPGVPTAGYAQERQFPRTGATIYGSDLPDSVIPTIVIEASYMAALQEDRSPGSLSVVVTPGKQVRRTKVDVLEKEYFESKGGALASATPILSAIEGLLAPLISDNVPAIYAV